MFNIRILVLAFISLSVGLVNNSYAESYNRSNWYIGGSGAYSYYPPYKPIPEKGTIEPIGIDVLKKGYALSVLAGYNFDNNLRADAEVVYRKHYFDKFKIIRDFPPRNFTKGQEIPLGKAFGYVQSFSFMTNVYYDFVNSTDFTPFFGLGVGFVRYEERNNCGNDVKYSKAIQVTPGVSYTVTENLKLDLSYRYYKMQDISISNKCLSPKIKYNTHEGLIGIRFSI